MMIVGGFLGFSCISLPYVEQGILLSILVFGGLIAASARFPLVLAALVTGAFALFHGHSHGTEIPAVASGLYYAAGFALSTAALHASGVGLGFLIKEKLGSARLVRYSGVAIALAGVALFL